MDRKMRKEVKIGLLFFAIFNIVNFIRLEMDTEILVLHFLLGGLAGLAFAEIAIGLLPEPMYLKLKAFKKSYVS